MVTTPVEGILNGKFSIYTGKMGWFLVSRFYDIGVCEWMNNFIPHFTGHMITYPCPWRFTGNRYVAFFWLTVPSVHNNSLTYGDVDYSCWLTITPHGMGRETILSGCLTAECGRRCGRKRKNVYELAFSELDRKNNHSGRLCFNGSPCMVSPPNKVFVLLRRTGQNNYHIIRLKKAK